MSKIYKLMMLLMIVANVQIKAQVYCTPIYGTATGQGTASNDYIAGVQLNTISNLNSNVAGSPSYVDYTSTYSTSLTMGQTYSMTITGSPYASGENYAVFIDYDDNGDFLGTNEAIYQSAISTNSNQIFTFNFTIPTGINPSNTRLRVVNTYNTTAFVMTSCPTTYIYGETEDYSIDIVAPLPTYCVPSYTNLPSSGDYIAAFTLNTINTTGTTSTVNYADYSSIFSTTLVAGGLYPVSITAGSYPQANEYYAIFIDYNGDGDFLDANESVYQTAASTTANQVFSFNITIPTGLNAITTRMRVVNVWSSTALTVASCPVYAYGETEDYTVSILVPAAAPVANFSANFGTITVGGSTSFTDLSTGVPTSWSWSFPGGTPSTSTAQNPTNIVYNTTGCHDVTLTATNAYGSNTITATCFINVVAAGQQYCLPNPTFGTTGGDFIDAVNLGTLSNAGTGSQGGSSYSYYNSITTILNGGTSYDLNVTSGTYTGTNYIAAWIDYNNDGDFNDAGEKLGQISSTTASSVNLINFTVPTTATSGYLIMRVRIADNAGGIANMDACTDYQYGETEDYIVTVSQLAAPVAGFTASAYNIVAGQNVTFTDLSTNAPTSWAWSFPGATVTTSTAQNPTVTYNAAGCYNVTLTATNAYGSDTYTFNCYITVTTSSIYCVTGLHSVDCSAANNINAVSITNTTLNVQNSGCSSGSELGYVLWSPVNNGTATLAKGTTYTFNVTSTIQSIISVWIDYNHDGTFATTEWKQITTSSTANVAASNTILIPTSALSGSTRMRVRSRNAGAANGNSDACTLFGSGETEDFTINIVNNATSAPVANFSASATTIQVGQSISFTDLSTNNPTSWSWTFTGGTPATSTTQNPANITYNTAGIYAVTLTATNSAGSNTSTQTTYINVLANVPCVTGIGGSCGTNDITSFTISNTTLQNINTSCSTLGADAYVSYPQSGSTTASLTKGNSYFFNVTTNGISIISLWIDYNHNGTYEASEWTQVATNAAANATSTVSIAIPTTATAGSTLMRVRSRLNGNPNAAIDACTNFGSGECEDYTITLVNPASTPVAAFNYGPNSVCVGTTVSFNNISTNATSYTWTFQGGTPSTSTNANPTVTWATSGAKTVTLVASNGTTTNTATQTISVNTIPTANAGSNVSICSGSSTNLLASGGASYSWSPTTGLSNPNIANPVATPSQTTTYTVTVSNGNCSSTAQVTVTVNSTLSVATSGNTSICAGGSTQIGATSTNGASFHWTPSTGLNDAFLQYPTASPTSTTTYTVTATNNGCSATSTLTVTVNNAPVVNLGNSVNVCSGSSTTLNAGNAGSTFSWSPSTGLNNTNTQSVVASPTATTTYIATVTNTNGCSSSGTVTVNVVTVNANAGQNVTICNGSSTTLSASGGTTYSWTPSTGLNTTSGQTVTASPSQTTTYAVTATTSGCSATSNVIVNVNTVNANAGNDVTVCAGQSAQLIASGGTSYSWSPSTGLSSTSVPNPTVTNSASTTYTVTVTNGSCTATDVVVLTVTNINASAGSDANICLGSSTQLAATGGTSYSWSPSTGLNSTTIASPVATPSSTTTYTVIASSNGCSNTASVTVNVNTATANAGNDITICTGNSVQLGATGGVSYSWSPSTGLSSATAANPVASPTTTTTYLVTATSGSCVTTDFVTVNVANSLNVSAGNDQTLCSGQTLQLNATGGAQYSWSPATGLSNSNIGNPIANPSATTTYTVTTFSGSCSSSAQVTITVVPGITANAGNNITLCNGASATLNATGGTTYSWSPATGLSNASIANPVAFPTSTTTYVVTATTGGCSATDTILVSVGSLTADAGIDVSLCSGQNTTLHATGGTSYSWSPSTGLSNANSANPVASPSSTTAYTVTVTNGTCTATDNITVSVSSVSVNAGQALQICSGGSATLNAQGSNVTNYSWTPTNGLSNPNIANPSASPTSTTLYTVVATDGLCVASSTVNVVVNSNPNTPVITTTGNGLTTSNAVGYQWLLNGQPLTGANSQQITPATNGSYSVVVTNGSGCTAVSAPFSVITVSIEDVVANNSTINIYPNPVSEILNIEFSKLNDNASIEIMDVRGRIVMNEKITVQHSTFDVSGFDAGVYFVRIKTDKQNIVKRIVKQ